MNNYVYGYFDGDTCKYIGVGKNTNGSYSRALNLKGHREVGSPNFQILLLADGLTRREAFAIERELIRYYNADLNIVHKKKAKNHVKILGRVKDSELVKYNISRWSSDKQYKNMLVLKAVPSEKYKCSYIEGSVRLEGIDHRITKYGKWEQRRQSGCVYKITIEGDLLTLKLGTQWVATARPRHGDSVDKILEVAVSTSSKLLFELTLEMMDFKHHWKRMGVSKSFVDRIGYAGLTNKHEEVGLEFCRRLHKVNKWFNVQREIIASIQVCR